MLKFLGILFLGSCTTISLNVTHTQGKANDIVDQEQLQAPKVDTNLSIPFLK